MKRFMAVAMLAGLIGNLAFTSLGVAEEPGEEYPYYTTGAVSEAENEERIDHVRAERKEKRERRSELTARDRELTERIERLKMARRDVRREKQAVVRAIEKDTFLLEGLIAIRGYVVSLFNCRMGESTNNYQEHGDHPNGEDVHGAYQYLLSTWAKAFGYTDPHMAPFFIQDWQTVRMWRAGRRGEFAAC